MFRATAALDTEAGINLPEIITGRCFYKGKAGGTGNRKAKEDLQSPFYKTPPVHCIIPHYILLFC
jgi:hypothetical protein